MLRAPRSHHMSPEANGQVQELERQARRVWAIEGRSEHMEVSG